MAALSAVKSDEEFAANVTAPIVAHAKTTSKLELSEVNAVNATADTTPNAVVTHIAALGCLELAAATKPPAKPIVPPRAALIIRLFKGPPY